MKHTRLFFIPHHQINKFKIMKNYFKIIIHSVYSKYTQLASWYLRQSNKSKIGYAVLLIIIIIALLKLISGEADAVGEVDSSTRKVVVASVSSLSNSEQDFPLIGTVTSVSEAVIRSEGSGRLTRVYKKLGDTVYAGAIIGEFENSGERAAVLQAQGAYEQAKAASTITGINSKQSGYSLADTKTQILNALSSAYISMDDAVRGKTDSAFSSPRFADVKFLLTVPDSNLINKLEVSRKSIESILTAREAKNASLNIASDLANELTFNQREVLVIKAYLDDLYTAYSKALPDGTYSQLSIDAGKASVQTARQAISGTLSSIASNQASLTSSISAAQVAGDQNAEISGTLAQAEAQVKQALGAYNAALSRLQKTIIRSPITGTLNSLTISTGDYVSSFTQVAVVSNNGALEVISYVTEDDAKRINAGSLVTIDSNIEGIVTRIAPALDPTTKKIEVRTGIKNAKSSLINGQSVDIRITKNKKSTIIAKNNPILIPLSSLKLTPRGASVFTVSASNTLISIPVKEGAILGEQIQILEGLRGNEVIVVDARGLKEGSLVVADAK